MKFEEAIRTQYFMEKVKNRIFPKKQEKLINLKNLITA